jgi:hypothetical protein
MSTGTIIELPRPAAALNAKRGTTRTRRSSYAAADWGRFPNLAAFASGETMLPLAHLPREPELLAEVQAALIRLGLLDPPIDRKFGPLSSWALAAFCTACELSPAQGFSPAIAAALLDPDVAARFPLVPGDDLAGRVVRAMQRQGYWFARHPACFNIVYNEGCGADGTPNRDAPNGFNDLRLVLGVDDEGVPETLGAWDAATVPGRNWTVSPEDPRGAARIAYGQYKAWAMGMHHAGAAGAHPALVQVADISVHRDLDPGLQRRNDEVFTGLFGINQHWGYDVPVDDIRNASAGCLVGRAKTGHLQFMALIKQDIRFVANNAYRFMTTVMPAGVL